MNVYESVVINPFFIVIKNVNDYVGYFKDFKYYNELVVNLSDDESIKEVLDLEDNQDLTCNDVINFLEMANIRIVPYYNFDLNKSIYISLTGNYRLKSVSNTEPIENQDVIIKISVEDTRQSLYNR